ncbi:chloride channel protein [Methanobacterium alcaliphilum]|uniref:chloride channel protein n=1 Tax=Methanobacterium alcaliphilum TaxID=392018 RepID=UPI00200B03A6|nr:chloride channel protein [Methanobacterium alcaliphilum]MCK9151053.1 chloride channel protein [Methanobacterium alcaliphilum]
MEDDFNLKSRVYWKRMGWGLLLGFISAIGAFIFIMLMDLGQGLFIAKMPLNWTPFSGPWWMIIIMTVAGLLVGLIHKFTSAQQLDVFDAVNNGNIDYKAVPSSLLASLISLVGGFSLGPEVPSGMLAAGLGSWVSKKKNMGPEITRTNVLSSVSGAYAGLFSSPLVVLIMLLESDHKQNVIYYGTLFIAILSAVIGFSIFYLFNDLNYSSLLGILSPPAYDLHLWHLGASVLLGIVAVPFALLLVVSNRIFARLAEPFNRKPVLRSIIGGFALGVLAIIIPSSIGLGTAEMSVITSQSAEIGVVLLLVFALVKIMALSGALNFGFIGGPIFPMLFVGSCIGSAINLLFPQIPPGLAWGCMIVAVPAAIVPIPIALGAIGIVIIGLSPTNALPVFISALVAYSITHGLLGAGQETPIDS